MPERGYEEGCRGWMRTLLLPVWLCVCPLPHTTRCEDIRAPCPALVDPAECVHR
ncbi:hypothetical protein ACHAWF_016484 [Thalassiosira exigua]